MPRSIRYEAQQAPECKGCGSHSGPRAPVAIDDFSARVEGMTNKSTHPIKPLVAVNWKMNGLRASLAEITRLKAGLGDAAADVLICPPATLVAAMADAAAGSTLMVGGQDCHQLAAGAHTGDISAAMLRDAGASAVIVGHSERRTDHGETDLVVRSKAEAALRADLVAIICVGETADQRKAGRTLELIAGQLENSMPDMAHSATTVIAYEPVWAIGTGLTPTPADIVEVHGLMRDRLAQRFGGDGHAFRLLYGGSVKPANARDLLHLANVNGALVGGASLKADDFLGILAAYHA